ncbi:tetratricopeptide repeat protein [Streptomyces pseudogriseolus]|uniref:tetratricopeptide repeat protein n=1 Tax=Streptomyces pseudogriseolus TaxID=36817 RepID=UPI003FA2553A
MPLFSTRPSRRPRMSRTFGDTQLDKVLGKLSKRGSGKAADADLIAELLEQTGSDWDLRGHRVSVLAAATAGTGIAETCLERAPDDADALVFHSWTTLVRALEERRLEDPDAVISRCHRAAELAPDDPSPWVVLLGTARVVRYDHQDVDALWRQATARDPWNREAFLQMLALLSPEEGGSSASVLDFVDAVRSRIPANAPCAAVELTAAVRQYQGLLAQGGMRAMTAGQLFESGHLAAALHQAAALWPKPGFFQHAAAPADLNVLAYALCAAGRAADAHPVFEALQGMVTPWPWDVDGPALQRFEQHLAKSERGRQGGVGGG